MIPENQDQELELELNPEEEVEEEKKPELTLEQKRGILKRQLTKVEKELGVAEPKEKPAESSEKPEAPQEGYSLKDIKALSDVHDDDVDEIVDFAKFKKISISEAKTHPAIQAILRDNQEKRETAKATNTGGGRRGATETPDGTLIDKAKKGVLEEHEMAKAAIALMEQQKKEARGT